MQDPQWAHQPTDDHFIAGFIEADPWVAMVTPQGGTMAHQEVACTEAEVVVGAEDVDVAGEDTGAG